MVPVGTMGLCWPVDSPFQAVLHAGHKHEVMFAKIGHLKIRENCTQKFLGIIIDRNLKLDQYILIQCKKAGRKIKARKEFARKSLHVLEFGTFKNINESFY